MKKLVAVILSCALLLTVSMLFTACGEEETAPKTGILGVWGGRGDDTQVQFNDDGTCVVGGTTGTYEVKDDKTLVMTPNGGSQVEFKWSGEATDKLKENEWTISGDKIKINGYEYSKDNDSSSKTNNSSQGNASSGTASSGSGTSSNSASSASSGSGSSSTSSSTSSSASSGGSSQSSGVHSDGDETPMPVIVENLD